MSNQFTPQMARDIVEDNMLILTNPNARGMATGLCSAFYMSGLLSEEEWRAYLKRIPVEETHS